MPVVLIFIFGLLASAFSLLLEILFLPGLFVVAGATALGVSGAALIEECSKLLFLLAARRRGLLALEGRSARLMAGLSFGIGFWATEGALSAIRGTLWQSGSLVTGGLHVLTALLLVWGFSSSGSLDRKRMAAFLGAAILVHLAYNLALFTA